MKNILIVEDDESLRQSLVRLLQHTYCCEGVSTLKQGYHFLDKNKFDLVIVDRMLPDGDGLEFIEYLHDSYYQTKVIAIPKNKSSIYINIFLTEDFSGDVILIVPKENPAYRILREVVNNKKIPSSKDRISIS